MYKELNPLSNYLRLERVRITDWIFMLHTNCTFVILVTGMLLLSAKHHFGEPILCLGDTKHMDYVQSYCWTMGTYILSMEGADQSQQYRHSAWNNTHFMELLNKNFQYARLISIAEGVGPEIRGVTERMYLRYYQWVVLILLVQAMIFYFPSYLWKIWEGKYMEHLCSKIGDALIVDNVYMTRLAMLTRYFLSGYSELHFRYASKNAFCELLNLIISLFNIWMMDVIFNGFWHKYTNALTAIATYDWDLWNRMSSRVFPKVAKCEMFTYGPSGNPNILDILCILPLNILNEKLYAVLYIWFLFLTMLAAINLINRLVLITCPELRLKLLRRHLQGMPQAQIRLVLSTALSRYGDWFVLMSVGNNVNPLLFRDLLGELYVRLSEVKNPQQYYLCLKWSDHRALNRETLHKPSKTSIPLENTTARFILGVPSISSV